MGNAHEIVRTRVEGGGAGAGSDADPITTEVIRRGLEAAADQMRLALRRTAFSILIYEMTDFAAALYDRNVRLLAQGQAVPLFMGTLSFAIEASLETIGGEENLEPGDVIINTYGYEIGSHPQDVTVIAPGFIDDTLVGYAAIKAHHLDVGAKEMYSTDTTDVFQEGMILPSLKLYRRGELQEEIYRTALANSRLPKLLGGDLNAQVGALRTGLSGLYRVIERYGLARFEDAVERMFDHGEALARQVLETIPDGTYVGHGAIDSDGISDELVEIEARLEVSGGNVVVDMTDTLPQRPGSINCPLPSTVSAVRCAVMALVGGSDQSANEGYFRPIEVRTRPGTLYHPLPPAPIFMYWWGAQALVDVIHRALADAMPEAVPAGNGGDLLFVQFWGTGEDGSFWGDGMDHTVGHGADFGGDATAPFMHIAGSGIRNTPQEIWEIRRPFVVEKFEFAPDSSGSGRFRGGPGIDYWYRAVEDCYLTLPFERVKTAPWGLHGGADGRANGFRIVYPDGSAEEHDKVTGLFVPKGSVLQVRAGGGGGYGSPSERDPDAVHDDVREGYISEEAARASYPHAFEEGSTT